MRGVAWQQAGWAVGPQRTLAAGGGGPGVYAGGMPDRTRTARWVARMVGCRGAGALLRGGLEGVDTEDGPATAALENVSQD